MNEFQRWVKRQPFNEYAIKMFDEAITNYNTEAYNSSFIMTYIGFLIVVKDRIIDRKSTPPQGIEINKWEAIITELENPQKWDDKIFGLMRKVDDPQNSKFSIFKLDEDIRDTLLGLRHTRNKIAHGHGDNIDYFEIETFWKFLRLHLNSFNVGGSFEYAKNALISSFDVRKLSPNNEFDYKYYIDLLIDSSANDSNEIEKFFSLLVNSSKDYFNIENYKIFVSFLCKESNCILFNALLKTTKNEISANLFEYSNPFINIILEQNLIKREMSNDIAYINELISKSEKNFYSIGSLFQFLSRINVYEKLNDNSFNGLFSGLIKRMKWSYFDISSIPEIFFDKGFLLKLSEEMHSINWSDFDRANQNENLFPIAMQLCEIDNSIYHNTVTILEQRKTSYYSGGICDKIGEAIIKPEVSAKYLAFENSNNETKISSYYGLR